MNFYISRGKHQFGQYSEDDIRYGLAEGRFLGSDLGWQRGMSEWTPLDELIAITTTELPPRAPKPVMAPYVRKPVSLKGSVSGEGLSGFALVAMLMGMISLVAYGAFLKTNIASEFLGQKEAFSTVTVFCYMGAFIYTMIFGHRALAHISKSQGKLRGKGMALSGICMGYFLFMILTPSTVALALPAIEKASGPAINFEGAAKIRSKDKAQVLIAACLEYAEKNGGAFPSNLEILVSEKYLKNNRSLLDPLSRETPRAAYEYLGEGMKESDPSDAVVLRSQAKKNGKRVVAKKNGSVRFMASP